MRTVTILEWKNLVAYLAGRAEDTTSTGKLTPAEAVSIMGFLASDICQVWNREAWPALCDNMESITVTSRAFSKRVGAADEIGDILAVIEGGTDPRTTTICRTLPRDKWTDLETRVLVTSNESALWVDWQLPCPTPTAVIAYTNVSTLPEVLHYALACRAAAFLVADEDPVRTAQLGRLAEMDLNYRASKITTPWWRKSTVEG